MNLRGANPASARSSLFSKAISQTNITALDFSCIGPPSAVIISRLVEESYSNPPISSISAAYLSKSSKETVKSSVIRPACSAIISLSLSTVNASKLLMLSKVLSSLSGLRVRGVGISDAVASKVVFAGVIGRISFRREAATD
jgi:hypothetical protein